MPSSVLPRPPCCDICGHYSYKLTDPPCDVGARVIVTVDGKCPVRTAEDRVAALEFALRQIGRVAEGHRKTVHCRVIARAIANVLEAEKESDTGR